MANGRVDYVVGFTGDTTRLKAAINDAITSLQRLGTAPTNNITTSLKDASNAALELSNHLQNATNVNTGKLDLINFNKSLKQSGKSIQDYARQMNQLGPDGQKAFLQVANAIVQAELPLRRSSQLMDKLWISMKNTMNWKISSSAINAFVGGIQTAYGYSKDLDRSLNNIRIVAEKSKDEMKDFAKEANKAAKALNATTIDYTDASLIYYQQGLNDQEVKERTDTTIKMANVTRDGAQEVSDQMTAIWNNFDDGSKSLEYYSDVIVRLGADTASSSAEIAQGLEKYAAIASTVGLSYEYATAALATVTATTRQSADIVGNAFKTLFARVQGLKLGETLDDGTTLNKYSEALNAVGISIFDQAGQLKDMDNILDEMGNKWETLSKDQQVALAQTVAGVRQYTQLIALMDNWDFFEKNVSSAMNAEGSLDKQAQIYAESWEAARDRVRAAQENIYDSIINDQMFIDLDDTLTPLLDGVANVADAAGGLKGILIIAAQAMTALYGDKIAQGLRNTATNISIITGLEQKKAQAMQQETVTASENLDRSLTANKLEETELQLLREKASLQKEINDRAHQYTQEQMQYIENEKQNIALMEERMRRSAQQMTNAQNNINTYIDDLSYQLYDRTTPDTIPDYNQFFTGTGDSSNGFRSTVDSAIAKKNSLDAANDLLNLLKQKNNQLVGYEQLTTQFQKLQQQTNHSKEALVEFARIANMKNPESVDNISRIVYHMNSVQTATVETRNQISALRRILVALEADEETVEALAHQFRELSQATYENNIASNQYEIKLEEITNKIRNNLIPAIKDWASITVAASHAFSQIAMGIQSIQSLGRIWSDENISDTEKITQSVFALSMGIPALINGFSVFPKIIEGISKARIAFKGITFAANEAGEVVKKQLISKLALSSGWIAAAAIAAVAAITMAYMYYKKKKELMLKEAQKDIDNFKKQQEEYENNAKLIKQYDEQLAKYKLTGENKESLIETTDKLIEAYSLESSALAKLRGDLDDYDKLLEEVKEKQVESFQKQKRSVDLALKGSGTKVLNQFTEGRGRILFEDGNYNLDFRGYYGSEEATAQKILAETAGFTTTNSIISEKTIEQSSEAYVKLYNDVNKALEKMESTMSAIDLINSGVYQGAKKWRDSMTEVVNEYEELIKQQRILNLLTNNYNSQNLLNINKFSDFNSWYNELAKDSDFLSLTPEKRNEVISIAIAQSGNSKASRYNDYRLARGEILNKTKAVNESYINNFFADNENNEAAIAAFTSLNWALINSDENIEKLTNSCYNYQKALLDTTKATELLSSAQKTLKKISEDMSEEDILTIKGSFDWGNEEFGIMEFTEFLGKTAQEQQAYLNGIVLSSYDFISQNIETTLAEAQIQLQAHRDTLTSLVNESGYKESLENESIINQVKNAFNGGKESWENFINDENNKNKVSSLFTFQNLLYDNVVEEWESFKEHIKEDEIRIEAVHFEKNAIKKLEKQIEDSKIEILIQTDLKYDNLKKQTKELNKIYLDLFKGINDGFYKTFDANGKEVYEFSADAAEALAQFDSEALKNAEVTSQGTIQLSKEQYDAIIGNEKSIAKEKTKARIQELKDQAKHFFALAKLHTKAAEILKNENNPAGTVNKTIEEIEEKEKVIGHLKEKYLPAQIKISQDLINKSNEFRDIEIENIKTIEEYTMAAYARMSEAYIKYKKGEPIIFDNSTASDEQPSPKIDLKDVSVYNKDHDINYHENVAQEATEAGNAALAEAARLQDSFNTFLTDLKEAGGAYREIADRYHEINRAIEYQEQLLDDLDTQIDRTFGNKKIDLYKDKIKAINDLIGQKKSKLNIAEAAMNLYAGQLQSYGFNLEFVNGGDLNNYTKIWEAIETKRFEAERAGLDTKPYERQLEVLEKYEESLDAYRETQLAIEESKRQKEDTKLQEAVAELNLSLQIKNMDDAARDFSKAIVESMGDELTHGLEAAKLSAEAAKAEMGMVGEYANTLDNLEELWDKANKYSDTEAIAAEFENVQGEIISSGEALLDWIETLESMLPDALDAASERFDQFINQLEHNSTVLDTIKELLTLQGYTYKTAEGFAALEKVARGRMEASLQQAKLQRQWFEGIEIELREAEAALAGVAETDAAYDTLKNNRDALLEEYNEAQEAMLSAAKDTMDAAREIFVNAVEQASHELEMALTDNMGFDLLQMKYDNLIAAEERYLDKVNESYEMTKWNSKLQKSIDTANSIAAANRLKELQKEIDLRREGGKLSQYDLDILNAKYEMTLAQIALEEAQNNKSSMRLVRNSVGNWDYVFTADAEQIANAEAEYAEAQNNYYNIAKKEVKNTMDQMLTLKKDTAALIEEVYLDETLNEEERAAKIEEIRNNFNAEMLYLQEEYNLSLKDMNDAGNEIIIEHGNTFDEVFKLMGDTTLDFESIFNEAQERMEIAAKEYESTIDEVAKETGTDYKDLTETIKDTTDATNKVGEAGKEAADAILDSLDAIHDAIQAYSDWTDEIWDTIEALEKMSQISRGESGSDRDEDDDDRDYAYEVTIDKPSVKPSTPSNIVTNPSTGADIENEIKKYMSIVNNPNTSSSDYNKAVQILQKLGVNLFDTGGYTGSWGNSGKLAILHEKELVLNQQDTANILTAVSAIRTLSPILLKEIEALLDNSAIAGQNLMNARFSSSRGFSAGNTQLEQSVLIQAEFPGVSSAAEIEAALHSLVNDAAQYASINKN